LVLLNLPSRGLRSGQGAFLRLKTPKLAMVSNYNS